VQLTGKIALVTGASAGIGAAIAEVFAAAGARLLLTGRDQARGQAVADRAAAAGAEAHFIPGDMTDSAFCDRLASAAAERLGGLDVLVNNAGIFEPATAENTTDEAWRRTMAINLDALFFMSRAALPALRARGGGSIVNIASEWGLVGAKAGASYCASKGAVVLLTRAMALDHAREGIRVNAICPADVDTPMIDAMLAAEGIDPMEGRRALGDAIPMGRIGRPEEVGQMALYLASDASSFVTGTAIPIDGGNCAD
jgi:NAD(P)-dependent dehydrogenase (short-subunit alcohol dehydrogenase family)